MSEPLNDGGLILGKRMVWVFDGPNYAKAVSQFGEYECFRCGGGFRWELTISDGSYVVVVADGYCNNIAATQAACQSSHDLRAMASIQTAPFEWKEDEASVGELILSVWDIPNSSEWEWDVKWKGCTTITESKTLAPKQSSPLNSS
jgi:hypothetical protein